MESCGNSRGIIPEYITVGEITASFGNKGEVKVKILTDFPERFKKQKKFHLYKNQKETEVIIEEARFHKNFLLLKLKGYNNIKEAQELRGGLLQIHFSELTSLKSEHYYHFQIIGLDVYSFKDNKFLGKIKEILNTKGNDVYILEDSKILIPALKEVILKIDLKQNKMWINLEKIYAD
ncbi:MAG: 16S rRNA processing protein RimM [Armatimonadetes bacterium]|nr:16S rRNA processing protein RimM [Armatimonadota bacterium]